MRDQEDLYLFISKILRKLEMSKLRRILELDGEFYLYCIFEILCSLDTENNYSKSTNRAWIVRFGNREVCFMSKLFDLILVL